MPSDVEKIQRVKKYIEEYVYNIKIRKRAPMYGSPEMIEDMLMRLDDISFILQGFDIRKLSFRWVDFLVEKGYGSASATMRIKEYYPEADMYVELAKHRDEYEVWRDKKLKDL